MGGVWPDRLGGREGGSGLTDWGGGPGRSGQVPGLTRQLAFGSLGPVYDQAVCE